MYSDCFISDFTAIVMCWIPYFLLNQTDFSARGSYSHWLGILPEGSGQSWDGRGVWNEGALYSTVISVCHGRYAAFPWVVDESEHIFHNHMQLCWDFPVKIQINVKFSWA